MEAALADLAVVIVSHGDARWLEACVRSVAERAGGIALQVIVVENGDRGPTEELLRGYPGVALVVCENHGFAHANNEGLLHARARHVLFLNPDTELVEGDLAAAVALIDERPAVGVLGVRQVDGDRRLLPSMRRAPGPLRALAEAIGAERVSFLRHVGERVIDPEAYARENDCDWVSGSFLLVRSEALERVGWFDERMFLFSEEVDLCTRVRDAGWRIAYSPRLTIVHHVRHTRGSARNEAQAALSRLHYARKHFGPARRAQYRAALVLRYALRARRPAGRAALFAALGFASYPYEAPPQEAVRPRPPDAPEV